MDLRDDIKVDIENNKDKGKKEDKIKEHDGIVGDPGPISPDDLIGLNDR